MARWISGRAFLVGSHGFANAGLMTNSTDGNFVVSGIDAFVANSAINGGSGLLTFGAVDVIAQNGLTISGNVGFDLSGTWYEERTAVDYSGTGSTYNIETRGVSALTTTADFSTAGTFTQNSSGEFKVNDGVTFTAGAISLNNGSVSIGSGATLASSGGALNNSTVVNVGAGGSIISAGAINNLGSGVISFAGSGTLLVDSDNNGTETITNAGRMNFNGGVNISAGSGTALFNNSGTMSMQNGATGDTVMINGNYTGTGSLLLDVNFGTGTADTLVINGNVTGGTTTIELMDITSGVASGTDVLVVDVTGTAVASDFALAGGAFEQGVFFYDLQLQNSQFFLHAQANATGAVYEAAPVALLEFANLSTLKQRVGGRQQLPGSAVWIRAYGENLNTAPVSSTAGNAHVDSTAFGLQAGIDIPLDAIDAGEWVLGVTAQYGSINTSVANTLGTGRIDSEGYDLGVIATWYGNNGLYADTQGHVSWISSDISSSAAGTLVEGHDSIAYATSIEVGQRFALSNGKGALVPQTQVSWGRADGGSFTDNEGNAVDLGVNSSAIGRIGLAYEFENGAQDLNLYVIGNVLHTFSGFSDVSVVDATLSAKGEPTWGEIGFGGNYKLSDATMLYSEASYSTSFSGNASNNNRLSATAGLRIQW